MFSENYKTAKSVLSILFVFSILFSPFYYSVNVAFANEEGVDEIVTNTSDTDTNIVDPEPVVENQATENNESEETILEETPVVNEEQETDIETPDTSAAPVMMMSAMSLDQVSNDPIVYVHTCALPNSLGDSTVEPLVHGWDPMSLQDVFNSLLIDRNVVDDQKQYQAWDAQNSTTTISVEFTNKISALNHVFGYYRNGDISTFVPVFRSGLVSGFESVPEFSFGHSATLDIVGSGSIGFAIKTSDGNTYATLNSLNENGNDHAVAYDWADNTYYISFEDLALDVSDVDYNDVTVKVTVNGCQNVPQNPYCPNGGDMTYDKFIEAKNAGDIGFDLSATNTPYYSANLYVTNKTSCTFPVTFESYKVFGGQAVPQQFLDRSEVIATSTSILQVRLADCMSQVDWFYGTRSMESDSDPTTVFAFLMGFLVNATQNPAAFGGWNSLPPGGYCPVSPENTPPTITIIGDNPLNITVDTVFVDPGATATDLEDGDATTTAHIVVSGTVNASTTGSYILTYSVTDSGGLSTSTTRTVVVNPVIVPPVNPPSGGGGGGSSGGHRHPVVVGEILGATSCSYLRDYLKIDWQNDKVEVLKLQSFLNVFEKENLSLTGVFDQTTFDAVVRFQTKYSEDILEPWGDKVTTGFVYILTKKKVNEIYCNTIYPLSQVDQNEIDAFRNFDGTNSGASVEGSTGSSQNFGTDLANENENSSLVVELKDDSKNQSVVRNAAVSLFALPQKMFGGLSNSCGYTSMLLFLILLAIIIAIIKLFMGPRGPKNVPIIPTVPVVKTDDKKEPIVKTESPIITLPGVLPDEEIIIENPEEGSEEVLVTTPDLRDDKTMPTDRQETN